MSYNLSVVKQNKNKPIILTIAACFIMFLLLSYQYVDHNKEKLRYTKGLNNKIIVLDAGHGGVDPGTNFGNLKEKDINMAVIRKLEEEFHNNKVKIFLTREESQGIMAEERMNLSKLDDNLQQRKALAHDETASVFVSVHVNSSPSNQPSGTIVYYQNKNQYHQKLALSIQKELNKLYSEKWSPKEANFVVVKNTEMPSVLVEIGFITNPQDRKFISSSEGQKLIAKGIFQGIKNYTEELKTK
jgi:N-acetylmuramoyl-L-alanine amidase